MDTVELLDITVHFDSYGNTHLAAWKLRGYAETAAMLFGKKAILDRRLHIDALEMICMIERLITS